MGAADVVVRTKPSLGNTRVGCSISQAAEVRILNHVGHGRGNKWRPVLSKECEGAGLIVESPIESHPSQSYGRLAGPNRRDVAIVRAGEVALKVKFNLAGNHHVRSGIEPLESRAQSQATCP